MIGSGQQPTRRAMTEAVRSVQPDRPVADDKPEKVYTVRLKAHGEYSVVYYTDIYPQLMSGGTVLHLSEAIIEYKQYYEKHAVTRYDEEKEIYYVVANLDHWSVKDNLPST